MLTSQEGMFILVTEAVQSHLLIEGLEDEVLRSKSITWKPKIFYEELVTNPTTVAQTLTSY